MGKCVNPPSCPLSFVALYFQITHISSYFLLFATFRYLLMSYTLSLPAILPSYTLLFFVSRKKKLKRY